MPRIPTNRELIHEGRGLLTVRTHIPDPEDRRMLARRAVNHEMVLDRLEEAEREIAKLRAEIDYLTTGETE